MNEVTAVENTRSIIEQAQERYLTPTDWKVDSNRRQELYEYKEKLDKTPPNMPASKYKPPPGTQFDITKVSKTSGIRCLQIETDQFNHKVPLDRMLMCLELAKPHDDPSQVMFPYGFTENTNGKKNFNITNVIMPLSTFEGLSRDISNHFNTDRVYNQPTT